MHNVSKSNSGVFLSTYEVIPRVILSSENDLINVNSDENVTLKCLI